MEQGGARGTIGPPRPLRGVQPALRPRHDLRLEDRRQRRLHPVLDAAAGALAVTTAIGFVWTLSDFSDSKDWSPRGDSNPHSPVYKTGAVRFADLPVQLRGDWWRERGSSPSAEVGKAPGRQTIATPANTGGSDVGASEPFPIRKSERCDLTQIPSEFVEPFRQLAE